MSAIVSRLPPIRVSLLALVLAAATDDAVAVEVWVDFTSDFHDGANGDPNGVADWIDELNQATAVAGVPAFDDVERATIETNILADLSEIYAEYDVDFVTTEPAGEHDVIYMARDNDYPDVSSNNLGISPLDLGNQDTNGYTTRNGNPSGVPRVTTANFDNFLESSDSRAQQITEISTSLAGTAGHELGHSFGLLHQLVYSHPFIDPSNYSNTLGVQNSYLMATGSTGISESERELRRSLSPFSRVMMDLTGGSDASSFEENNPLVEGGIVSERNEARFHDAGGTTDRAYPLTFATGPTSGLEISFVEAHLDSSSRDIDIFRFSVPADATLTAHVFSERLDLGQEFDPALQLLDGSGTVLKSIDDISWNGDHYNDLSSPEEGDDDPFLLNWPLTPGDYYLRVFPATIDVSDTPNPGDIYWLVTALDLAPLAGDFNLDGVVDAVDYAVWREGLGSLYTVSDYDDWKANFGASPTLSSISIVPEPSAALLAAAAFVGATSRRRRAKRLAPGAS